MQAVAAYRVLDTFPAQRCEATFQVRLGSWRLTAAVRNPVWSLSYHNVTQ
jgi:hypothetical protein